MPFIGPEKGALLQQIIRECKPHQVVEVGSMAGYSALTMAQALGPDGQVISLESDWKWALAAKRFVWQATQGDKSSMPVSLIVDSRALAGAVQTELIPLRRQVSQMHEGHVIMASSSLHPCTKNELNAREITLIIYTYPCSVSTY